MRFRLAYIATSSLSPTTISKVPPLPQLEPPKTTGSITNTDNNQSPFDQDSIFNEWCHQMGIQCPHAAVRTGPESVAGRGVFATSNVNEGDVVISIPYDLALTQENAARFFPELEEELVRCRRRIMSGNDGRENGKRDHVVQRFWSKVFRRTNSLSSAAIDTKFNPDDFWQAELTAYALAALDANHPWSTWISQWLRDDPLQTLVDQQQDNTLIHYEYDEQGIRDAVENFHDMAPQIPKYKIDAAVRIRLHELQQYIQNYRASTDSKKKDESSNDCIPISKSMYTTLISRAIGLSDTITACLPMHDMINHSNEPNLGFTFCDGNFEMVALRDIGEGEELFLEYMDVSREEETDGGRVRVAEWDEDKATWLLAQWGIPSKPETTKKEKDDEADLKRLESLPIL